MTALSMGPGQQQTLAEMVPSTYIQMPVSQNIQNMAQHVQHVPIGVGPGMGQHPAHLGPQLNPQMMAPPLQPHNQLSSPPISQPMGHHDPLPAPQMPRGPDDHLDHLEHLDIPADDTVLSKFSFFRGLTEKKTTRDGQPQKRRGPKPDSKPALTRRQELNRQAQRTHRERKEMYIRALEQEVLRLKELIATVCQERDLYLQETMRLREILASHGVHPEFNSPNPSQAPRIFDDSSTGSYGPAGTESTRFTSPPQMNSSLPVGASPPVLPHINTSNAQILPSLPADLDYDQIGTDFVLTLERPCMDHMQFLMVRSNDSEAEISGHVLMATCPPASHIEQHPEVNYPHQMPSLGMKDLARLLDLSNRLPLDGEITPIMAWSRIMSDPRLGEFDANDLVAIRDDLLTKVRCYGFGAVLEDFEVRDAIETALTIKAKAKAAAAAAAGAASCGDGMGNMCPPMFLDQKLIM